MPHQVDGSQRVGGGHVGPCLLNSPNGKLGLAHVVLTGCQGIPKSLPDHALKVRVHVGMRAQPAAKGKPRRVFLPPARPLTELAAWPRA